MEDLISLGFWLSFFVVSYFVGTFREKAHLKNIIKREKALLSLPALTLKSAENRPVVKSELVIGNAHELGHYAHRDHLHGWGRGLVLLSIMTVLGVSGDAPGFIAPSLQTFDLKYSRDRESAADLFAIDTLVRTYGHAGGSIDAFKVMARQDLGVKRPEIVSTHPDTVWRMESLANYIKGKKYPEGAVKSLPGSGALPFSDDDRKGYEQRSQPLKVE